MADPKEDTRTASQLLRQWQKLNQVRGQLVRAGSLNGDASLDDVLECLRKTIPADMFS